MYVSWTALHEERIDLLDNSIYFLIAVITACHVCLHFVESCAHADGMILQYLASLQRLDSKMFFDTAPIRFTTRQHLYFELSGAVLEVETATEHWLQFKCNAQPGKCH
jgi:hypothetical protein